MFPVDVRKSGQTWESNLSSSESSTASGKWDFKEEPVSEKRSSDEKQKLEKS